MQKIECLKSLKR